MSVIDLTALLNAAKHVENGNTHWTILARKREKLCQYILLFCRLYVHSRKSLLTSIHANTITCITMPQRARLKTTHNLTFLTDVCSKQVTVVWVFHHNPNFLLVVSPLSVCGPCVPTSCVHIWFVSCPR